MLDNDVFAVALIYFWLIIAHEAQAVESISYEAGFLKQPAPAAPSQNCMLPLSGRGLAVRRVDFALCMFKLWATRWLGDYYSPGFDSQEFGELVTLNCDLRLSLYVSPVMNWCLVQGVPYLSHHSEL